MRGSTQVLPGSQGDVRCRYRLQSALTGRCTALALVGVALGFIGCAGSGSKISTVRIEDSDTGASPPHSTLKVEGRDVALLLSSGSEPEALTLGTSDSLLLIATGEDAKGGIKDLSLTGSLVVTCKDAVTGKTTKRASGFLRKNFGANPKTSWLTRKSSLFTLRSQDLTAVCKGLEVLEVVGQATVSAINFKGHRATSSRLEFRMVPVLLRVTEVEESAIKDPKILMDSVYPMFDDPLALPYNESTDRLKTFQ